MYKNVVLLNIAIGLCCAFLLGWITRYHINFQFPFPLLDYVVAVLGTSLILLFTDFFLVRLKWMRHSQLFEIIILWLYFSILAYFLLFLNDWKIWHFFSATHNNIYQNLLSYSLILIPLSAIVLYPKIIKHEQVTTKAITFICLTIVLVISIYMGSFVPFNELHKYHHNAYLFQIVLNPIVQIFLGNAPVIDLQTQYGFYGIFFEPILKITGASLASITSIFSIILICDLFMVGFLLYRILHNKILAIVGFIAYLYLHYFALTSWPDNPYFQYHPIRTLFPTIALFLFYRYIKNRSQINYCISLCILSIGFLWNIDTAVIAFSAFLLGVCTLTLSKDHSYIINFKNIFWKILQATLVLALTGLIFTIYLRLRYLTWPDYSLALEAQDAFLFAFTLLKINSYPVWILVATLYITGISLAIRNIANKFFSAQQAMIAVLSILGIGLFVYYANNIWVEALSLCTYPATFIALILTDMGLKNKLKSFHAMSFIAAIKNIKFNNPINYFLLTSVVIFSLVSVIYFKNIFDPYHSNHVRLYEIYFPNTSNEKDLWFDRDFQGQPKHYKVKDLAGNNPTRHQPYWVTHADRLKTFFSDNDISIKGKKIMIFSLFDAYLHMELEAPSALDVTNTMHISWGNQRSRVIDDINAGSAEWIIYSNDKVFLTTAALFSDIEKNYTKVATIPTPDVWYRSKWEKTSLLIYHRKDLNFRMLKPLPK